jgi:hypothetical protein
MILVLLLLAACEDVRRFEGTWAGPISADPAYQQGFGASAILRLQVASVSRRAIAMNVDLPERGGSLPFEPIRGASQDALGDLRLDGEPLRTFLGYVRPPATEPFREPFLTVVSLFPEDRIEARIIRGPEEIYGVFSLLRVRETARSDAAQR